MIRRIFAIWPPAGVLATAGLIYLGFQAFYIYLEVGLRVPVFSLRDDTELLLLIVLGFGVLYAAYRIASFHPAFRADYYEWLSGTPWTSRKPLPLGPIHLVWQDALLLAIAFALAWPRADGLAIVVVQGFLLAYLLCLGFTHYFTGQKAWGYAVLFGVGFMILFARALPMFFGTASLVYGIAYLGLRAALAAFPWQERTVPKQTLQTDMRFGQKRAKPDEKALGWPYDRLGPERRDDIAVPWDFKLVFGVLMGWWLFVVHSQLRIAGAASDGYVSYYWFLFGGMVYRLAAYCNGYMPPLDLHGRLATGRLIIPGYDQVFVAPLFALGVGVAAWYVPLWFDIDPLYVTSVAFVITWWILFAMPPSLKTWRLTGNHQITPGLMKSAQQ
jgi:hypothetical protein